MAHTDTDTPIHPGSEPAAGPLERSTPLFATVLCAVDGTNASRAAVRLATDLARPRGVVDLLAVMAEGGAGKHSAAALSRTHAQEILADGKRVVEEAGASARTAVDTGGPPLDVIIDRARGHDLLAIGAPVTSWLGGMLLGGIAAQALGRLEQPLLVVRPEADELSGGPIVVATDGEPGSDDVVELGARLAQRAGMPAIAVHATESESGRPPWRVSTQAGGLRRTLDGGAALHVAPGEASDVILAAAREHRPSVIVVGSRGTHGLRALGSVSRRVVYDAPCSVLVCPPRG